MVGESRTDREGAAETRGRYKKISQNLAVFQTLPGCSRLRLPWPAAHYVRGKLRRNYWLLGHYFCICWVVMSAWLDVVASPQDFFDDDLIDLASYMPLCLRIKCILGQI